MITPINQDVFEADRQHYINEGDSWDIRLEFGHGCPGLAFMYYKSKDLAVAAFEALKGLHLGGLLPNITIIELSYCNPVRYGEDDFNTVLARVDNPEVVQAA